MTILSLQWKSILEKTVFILRQGPGSIYPKRLRVLPREVYIPIGWLFE